MKNSTDKIIEKAKIWQSIAREAYQLLTFQQLHTIYQTIFAEEPLPIAWLPDKTASDNHIQQAIADLGIKSYQELYHWSVTHPSELWEYALDHLHIQFDKKYEKVLDISDSNEKVRWLPEARWNIIRSCFTAEKDKTALLLSDESGLYQKVTYGELESLTGRVVSGLNAMGLAPQDRILLYMPLNKEAVVAYLGIIRAGMTAVLVADSFSPGELQKRYSISEAKAIITIEDYQYMGKPLKIYEKVKKSNLQNVIVVKGSGSTSLAPQDIWWDTFMENEPVNDYFSGTSEQHISILFSSGTTKAPKAIPWNQTTPIKCATDAYFHHDVQPSDTITWTTGMGWMMGPWVIFAALINQATLALFTGAAATPAFGNFVEKAGITMLGTIPSLVKVWRETQAMEPFHWRVRIFSSTGEPSNAEDYLYLMWLARFRAPVIEYCGGTEIGGGYITGSIAQPATPGTFTTPALGLRVIFRNEQTGRLGEQEEGEVFLAPPSIGLSQELLNRDHHEEYYKNSPRLQDGTLLRKHGDNYQIVGQIGNTTFYRSQGRADDVMNLGGIKVSAVELETLFNTHEEVFESAAIATAPHNGGPEQLVVFFVPSTRIDSDKETKLKKELQALLSSELNPLFRIKELVAIGQLPRTASNKLMRRKLRTDYQSKL